MFKHYLKIRDDNAIIDIFSEGVFPNHSTEDYICYNEEGSYQVRLYPNGEENPTIFSFDDIGMIPLYKYEDGEILQRTQGEIKIEKALNLNKQLPKFKEEKISQSKTMLANYLASHPLVWTDGKQYSVTQEKQSLLSEQLALYALDNNAKLYWNAKGEARTEWEAEDLLNLGKAISSYVHPYVLYQQEKELEIKSAEFVEDLDNIVIDYGTVVVN